MRFRKTSSLAVGVDAYLGKFPEGGRKSEGLSMRKALFGRIKRLHPKHLTDPRRRANRVVQAMHSEMSVISSAVDDPGQPNEYLIDLLLRAGSIAPSTELSSLADRCSNLQDATFVQQWPGEHYRLLAALGVALNAQSVLEIGTFTGLSALALRSTVPSVITNDIVPWAEIPGTVLNGSDFDSGVSQLIGDLSNPLVFKKSSELILAADFIFIDGPKNGKFEVNIEPQLRTLLRGSGKVVVWDDTRVMTMVGFWRSLDLPKIDATSLGHWSGTGIIQYC
jgi:predicted O-methyltransferase YrrM